MIQFRGINVKEAMEMIVNDDLKNLYFETQAREIACITDYKVRYDQLNQKKYFGKEEIK